MSKNLFGARLVKGRPLQRSNLSSAIGRPATVIVLERVLNAKGVNIGNIMLLKCVQI